MSETAGGAPQQAAQEQQRALERERFSSERTALTTRILMSGDALNPNKELPEVNADQLTHVMGSINKVVPLSNSERKAHWDNQPEKNFDQQKLLWQGQVKECLLKKLTTGTDAEKQSWGQFLTRIGFGEAPTNEHLSAFYETYFTGDKKLSNIGSFMGDLVATYTNDNVIDSAALSRDLDKIAWFTNVFGENTSKVIPSILEGFMIMTNPEMKKELIEKANEKDASGKARVNRPTDKEKTLLQKMFESVPVAAVTPSPTERTTLPAGAQEGETAPREKKSAIIITKEQIEAIKKKKIKLPGSESEITYEELVGKLIDAKTGKIKTETADLSQATKEFMDEWANNDTLKAELARVANTTKNILNLSPTTWATLDAIASESNKVNKEFMFALQGIEVKTTDNGSHKVLAATYAVPTQDFTTAKERKAFLIKDIYTERAKDFSERTKLDQYFDEHGKPKTGQYLMAIHTHQAPLGDTYIATPSKDDENHVKLQLTGTDQVYRWGILTKDAQGNLNLAAFASQKDTAGTVHHHRIAVVSPDLSEVKTIPANGFGEV